MRITLGQSPKNYALPRSTWNFLAGAAAGWCALEVAAGETAAAVCIDFYGRYEAQRTRDAAIRAGLVGEGAQGRIGYVDPPGETVIDPDPVALLTGAPDPELARWFVDVKSDRRSFTCWARVCRGQFQQQDLRVRSAANTTL